MITRHDGSPKESLAGGHHHAGIPGRYPLAVGTFRYELSTHTAALSPDMYAILGLDSETFDADAQSMLSTCVHPDDREVIVDAMRAVLDGQRPAPAAFRVVAPDGRLRLAWTSISVEYDAEGRPTALLGHVVDLGEYHSHRRIADARQRILEFAPDHSLDELLETTLDEAEGLSDSKIGFYHFVDADQESVTRQSWSSRAVAEYGEALGKRHPEALVGAWADCVESQVPFMHNGQSDEPDPRALPEDHMPIVRELIVPVVRQGRVRAILGVGNKPADYDQADLEAVSMLADLAWDVAETKVAQQALSEASDRHHMLYEYMNEGVIFQRADGMILSANPAAQRMLGLKAEEFTTRTSLDPRWKSVHEDGSVFPGSEHPTMVAFRTGLPVLDVTIGLFNPVENRWRWMIVSAVPLFRKGESSPYEAFVTLTDITEIKESHKGVDRTNELLTGLRDATAHLLAHHDLGDADVTAALQAIALSSSVDCAYVHEDREGADPDLLEGGGWFFWCREAGGVHEPPSDAERATSFRRWRNRFSAGGVVSLNSTEAECEDFAESAARGVSSVLAVPVFSDGRLWGCLVLEGSDGPRSWDPVEIETVRDAASTLGTTMELSSRALRDPLTGLYNRRYLSEMLIQTLAGAERDRSALSVITFDIDDFKRINDSHGHSAGDHALREIAHHLLIHSRAEDTVARLGGDEFAVVMPNATAENALKSIERWRRLVEGESTSWGIGGGMRLTISAGVSSTDSAHTVDELLDQADQAMLSAKRAGSNQSMLYGESTGEVPAAKAPLN